MDTAQDIVITEKFIDLEKVISSKNPKLLKYIPSFLLNYLKKILHVDELNGAIYRNREKIGSDFATVILEEFQAKINVFNEHLIPRTGRYIIVSNHPLGGLDGMALISVIGKVRKDVVFPVNDLLLFLPTLKPIFIPVNKVGSNSSQNAKLLHQTFASDKIVLYFPAGLCSRKISGQIMDLAWKKTFVSKAREYKRDVIPVYIDGKNSNFFYNLSNIRKKFGIKANLEMLYLVDEMYKQKNKNINIIIGEPVSYQSFDNSKRDREWAADMKNKVYELGNKFKSKN